MSRGRGLDSLAQAGQQRESGQLTRPSPPGKQSGERQALMNFFFFNIKKIIYLCQFFIVTCGIVCSMWTLVP